MISTPAFSLYPAPLVFGNMFTVSATTTQHNLNTSYSHWSSGAAVGYRYTSLTTEPITSVYVPIAATTGNVANMVIQANLCLPFSRLRPVSTIESVSSNVTPIAAGAQWIELAFPSPYLEPAVGDTVFFTVYNVSSSPTTVFPAMIVGSGHQFPMGSHAAVTTTDGFSNPGTQSSTSRAAFIVKHGTTSPLYVGTYAIGLSTFNTSAENGSLLIPPRDVVARYVTFAAGVTALHELIIYEFRSTNKAQCPVVYRQNISNSATDNPGQRSNAQAGVVVLHEPVALKRHVPYIFAMTSTGTYLKTVQDTFPFTTVSTDPTPFLVDGFTAMRYVELSGSGTWTVHATALSNDSIFCEYVTYPSLNALHCS